MRGIRRRVRLASGRSDGRCGKVAEAIEAELGWAYRWGHLRRLDGGICWIHCWHQLPDSTIVDATADQFELSHRIDDRNKSSDIRAAGASRPLGARAICQWYRGRRRSQAGGWWRPRVPVRG